MLYVLSGRGPMPPKEATTVLDQLLEDAERRAVEAGDDEMSFWLAVDSDNIDSGQKVWQAVSRWADTNDVYVADTSDPVETLLAEPGAALLALPADPDFSVDDDDALLGIIEQAGSEGIKVYCFNGQMYEVAVEQDEQPEAEPTPDLLTMPLGELKATARELGVTPNDWRSRGAIIEAIESHTPDTLSEEYAAPVEDVPDENLEDLGLDGDAPEATEVALPEAAPSQQVGVDEALVRRLVRSELTSILTDLLSGLLTEG
jgi:hypothetical protein